MDNNEEDQILDEEVVEESKSCCQFLIISKLVRDEEEDADLAFTKNKLEVRLFRDPKVTSMNLTGLCLVL